VKILLAVDGSSYSKKMLGYLAAHDEWLGAAHAYTVLHVPSAMPQRAAAVLPRDEVKAYYAEESEKVLKPIRAFLAQKKFEAKFVSKVGVAAEVIAKVAEDGHFDLLIMGSHGHSSITNLVLGSVATRVLAHCGTPVLLIR
jgi:nucleotide-binding universal stress UspA family protein